MKQKRSLKEPRRSTTGKRLREGSFLRTKHSFISAIDHVRRASHHSVSPRLVGWSVVVGVATGVVVSLFRFLISQSLVWLTEFYNFVVGGNWWWLGIAVAMGLVFSVFLAWLVSTEPLAAGSGIPDVESRLRSSKEVNFPWWRVLWRKIVGGLASICPGLFLGREGPSVQMGASVGMGVSGTNTTTRRFRRELVAAGAAAGLSAAFTAPIAGVLFVMEEIYSRFSLRSGVSAFAASLSASAVAVQVFGLAPVFDLPDAAVPWLGTYWQLIVLGIALGAFAWLYEHSLFWGFDFYNFFHIPTLLRPFIPLLLVIPVGIFLPRLLGGGNEVVTFIGNNPQGIGMIALFLVIRLVGSQLSYGSGVPGGIFLPMLTLGALGGMLSAQIFVALGIAEGSQEYLVLMEIVGMAGLFGAVSKAPLTAIILVMEMTSYGVLMPLGVVTLLSYLVYDALGGQPIYDELGARSARLKRQESAAREDNGSI